MRAFIAVMIVAGASLVCGCMATTEGDAFGQRWKAGVFFTWQGLSAPDIPGD